MASSEIKQEDSKLPAIMISKVSSIKECFEFSDISLTTRAVENEKYKEEVRSFGSERFDRDPHDKMFQLKGIIDQLFHVIKKTLKVRCRGN